MNALQTINYMGGFYFIDVKLKEFRDVKTAEPVKFNSSKGEMILTRVIRKKMLTDKELNQIF